MQLRDYQERIKIQAAKLFAQGKKKLIVQAPTGAGKTVIFSSIAKSFIEKNIDKTVLIIVHRNELLEQTLDKLNKMGVNAAPFTAQTKKKTIASCYVAMVETANNRVIKFGDKFFGSVGLLIADEAHLANHFKVIEHYAASAFVLGFSATPISSNKKIPLNTIFEDIICDIDVPQLIQQGALTQNITRAIKGDFERAKAKIKNGEFDTAFMANEYSKSRSLNNTLIAYERFAIHTKTVVFNVNVEHSILMTKCFLDAGYNAKHLDGTSTPQYRKECLEWLKCTPNAILNNVGVLTTGFDEPSVDTIIMNRSTKSLSLWIQIAGRGSRLFENKTHFNILDMGGNALEFGDWSSERYWTDIFNNPQKTGQGVAPVKECPTCEAILHTSVRECNFCGHSFRSQIKYDNAVADFQTLTNNIDIEALQRKADILGRKKYYTFFEIIRLMTSNFKKINQEQKIEPNAVKNLIFDKCKIWCHNNNKKFDNFHKGIINEQFKNVTGYEF